jgi:hypothetical protein
LGEFGIELSNSEFRENLCGENHTLLMGVNAGLPLLSAVFFRFD